MIKLVDSVAVILDEEDFNLIPAGTEWFLDKDGYCCLRVQSQDARRLVTVSLHRWIMWAKVGQLIDHVNGDKLNNTKYNLRFATKAENCRNRRKRKGTTSQYKGVYKAKTSTYWHSSIRVDGKQLYLGQFVEEQSAARAYDAAAKHHWGSFARLNF